MYWALLQHARPGCGRQRRGGVRCAVRSGGATMPVQVLRFEQMFGVRVLKGRLSETAPVVAFNSCSVVEARNGGPCRFSVRRALRRRARTTAVTPGAR